jgi:hypothetical protein
MSEAKHTSRMPPMPEPPELMWDAIMRDQQLGDALEDYCRSLQEQTWQAATAARDQEIARLRETLQLWSHEGCLQTFEDRERFRGEARRLLGEQQ